MRVIFCSPTTYPAFPYKPFLQSLDDTIVSLDEAGIGVGFLYVAGSPYISWARSHMLKVAMETDADAAIFLDHDLSWSPEDMLRVVRHPGEVVAADYRFKNEKEEYMGRIDTDENHRPLLHADGSICGRAVPAGFLKVTRSAVNRFREAYPELTYGPEKEFTDLFNHGAYGNLWWGEDYAFSRRWRDLGGDIHLIPDLKVNHHLGEEVFYGNLHEFLLKQPGGSEWQPQAT